MNVWRTALCYGEGWGERFVKFRKVSWRRLCRESLKHPPQVPVTACDVGGLDGDGCGRRRGRGMCRMDSVRIWALGCSVRALVGAGLYHVSSSLWVGLGEVAARVYCCSRRVQGGPKPTGVTQERSLTRDPAAPAAPVVDTALYSCLTCVCVSVTCRVYVGYRRCCDCVLCSLHCARIRSFRVYRAFMWRVYCEGVFL